MTDASKAKDSPNGPLFFGLLAWFCHPHIFLSHPTAPSLLPLSSPLWQSIGRKTTGIEGDDLL